MAGALKLANNFLAATTLAATSEAIAFGRSVGLDLGHRRPVGELRRGGTRRRLHPRLPLRRRRLIPVLYVVGA
ncbi:NAD-binding protein [Streptomyces olivochromogenes]|uniref:NAD-binding protein n=1 Tax=Streptomyces olivochromogenes TaxID=1963 RepID=UPI000748430E|nr:NAD-binding protein [Streptomyces olivochromogenes]KUN48673.1 hypothetical protein AQJ27_05620 [Streptomyces olivochromogenes]